MNESIKVIDFSIISGHRNEEQQDAAHAAGMSQKLWPDSRHNSNPSEGIDVAPYPIAWSDTERFVYMAGIIMGIAHTMGISLIWGGDWDRDTEVLDEKFRDFGHLEVVLPLDTPRDM